MRLALPLTFAGAAVAGRPYDPISAVPPAMGVYNAPLGVDVYVHQGRAQQMRTVLWHHTWGGRADGDLCVLAFSLDHDPQKMLRLGVDNNADIWSNPEACPLLPRLAAAKGYEWPADGYRLGPAPLVF
jgi:hypothetical protein